MNQKEMDNFRKLPLFVSSQHLSADYFASYAKTRCEKKRNSKIDRKRVWSTSADSNGQFRTSIQEPFDYCLVNVLNSTMERLHQLK